MQELIQIDYSTPQPTVSGRLLHQFLEVGTAYKDWFPRMCEYGFTEGEDFSSFLSESTGGRPATDHQLTVSMAKELCMLQRNERGKQARLYFLKVEEDWNSPEKVMARALQIADRKIKTLEEKAEQDRPKVVFADAVAAADNTILIGDLAKLISQNGVQIGQNRLFDWLRQHGFLIARGERHNMPTQRSLEHGLFRVTETVINDGTRTRVVKTTKVTGKGQRYFVDYFLTCTRVPN